MKQSYLVCYDICDDRRLSRLFRYIKQRGVHVQYSVFYCRLNREELMKLESDILGIIDSKKDDVRIYPLPSEQKVTVIGCGDRVPEGVTLFLR